MPDLTTLANVRQALNLVAADTGQDAFLTNLVTRSTDIIRRYVRRNITQEDAREEIRNGRGKRWVNVKEWPIRALTSLHESEDQTWDSTTLYGATEYVVDAGTGIVYLKAGTFGRAPQSIRLVFDAGYVTVPAAIEDACIQLVTQKWNRRGAEGVGSKSLGDGSITYFTEDDLTKSIRRLLDPFRSDRT